MKCECGTNLNPEENIYIRCDICGKYPPLLVFIGDKLVSSTEERNGED